MRHVLPPGAANDRRPFVGTNSRIEQPFAPMAAPYRPPRPNVLLIHACDLGAAEIGAYGGPHAETPNLDRLALSGVRFTEAYASAGDPLGSAGLIEDLGIHGYNAGSFGTSDAADLATDVESAVAFIGRGGPVPWAASIRLHARPTPTEPLASVLRYAHAVAAVDDAIGRLVTALRRTEQYRSSLVLLVGASESERLVFDRMHQPDGARTQPDRSRVPTLLSWPGRIPPRQRHEQVVVTADWTPTLLTLAEVLRGDAGRTGEVDLTTHLFDGGDVPARDEQVRAA